MPNQWGIMHKSFSSKAGLGPMQAKHRYHTGTREQAIRIESKYNQCTMSNRLATVEDFTLITGAFHIFD